LEVLDDRLIGGVEVAGSSIHAVRIMSVAQGRCKRIRCRAGCSHVVREGDAPSSGDVLQRGPVTRRLDRLVRIDDIICRRAGGQNSGE
jgi:hypothetical protein